MSTESHQKLEVANSNIHETRRYDDLVPVLVIDFGSQYTHLIMRRVRENHIWCVCKAAGPNLTLSAIHAMHPSLIILSGGPHSVHTPGLLRVPDGFFDYTQKNGITVLGICYGLQLIVKSFGGTVKPADHQEYGRMDITITQTGTKLYANCSNNIKANHDEDDFDRPASRQTVWMSHGDEAVEPLPPGFKVVARSAQGNIVAIENADANIYALQYHPEVSHSERGPEMLQHFLQNVCQISHTGSWHLQDVLTEMIVSVTKVVGPDDHVLCALSGGVDSTVVATLVHRAIGDRLHCVFVDNGLLRYKERERVMSMFESELHLPVTCVDASARFLSMLEGVEDPEKKRKIIGAEFIAVFDDFANSLEKQLGTKPAFLVQGTIYPDVIESCPPPSSTAAGNTCTSNSHTIKSHHNVGGLPANTKLKTIEPLKWLFKDEVRKLGALLGIPQPFLSRHPFPGPGLAIRIIGDVTKNDALETIRAVDEIFVNSIREANLYDKIWQAFVVYLPVKSVGVQGDQRTYSHSVALRAISSEDGMTADWYNFDGKFLADVSSRICNNVRGINRVVYDITSKPPSTIEWE